jgi:hypothetical protein
MAVHHGQPRTATANLLLMTAKRRLRPATDWLQVKVSEKSDLCYDRRSVDVSFGVKRPSGAQEQIYITVWQLRVC